MFLLIFLLILLNNVNISIGIQYKSSISVENNGCYNELCYSTIENVANSPLVECSYLTEDFYDCEEITDKNSTANCTKWGGTKYSDVQMTSVLCTVFEGIECRGNRTFEVTVPCIKYTNKYFISTVLYSIFLGIFAVDRFCMGHSGIAVVKVLKLYFNASTWSPTGHQWNYLLSCLNKADCEYINRFKFKHDCKIRLLSQLLIRYSVQLLTDTSWSEIDIDRASHGKPFCRGKQLDFNISHSSDCVVIAAVKSPDHEIGVDIMKVDTSGDSSEQYKRIMRKAYTETERHYIESKSTIGDKKLAFYRHWTLKESYVKAIGQGIRVELNKLDFRIQDELGQQEIINTTRLYVDSVHKECKFYEQILLDNYITSICLHSTSPSPSQLEELQMEQFKETTIENFLKTALPVQSDADSYWQLYQTKDE